jgi:peptidoglycan/xylan/chitin deacetylase (PgdA/CDA1 family)
LLDDREDLHMRLRQSVRWTLAAALPRALLVTHGPRWSRTVCLTFDDGPHPEITPRLLDVLAREGIKATFFVVGRQAERCSDLVRRLEAEGHTVGHHSYSHPDPTITPGSAMRNEVRRSSRALHAILGHPVHLYRPPRGKLGALDFPAVWSLRQTIVLWNVDPKDYSRPSSDEIVDWFTAHPLRGGDLILLHDSCAQTVAALPAIAAGARRSGLAFGTLGGRTRRWRLGAW